MGEVGYRLLQRQPFSASGVPFDGVTEKWLDRFRCVLSCGTRVMGVFGGRIVLKCRMYSGCRKGKFCGDRRRRIGLSSEIADVDIAMSSSSGSRNFVSISAVCRLTSLII